MGWKFARNWRSLVKGCLAGIFLVATANSFATVIVLMECYFLFRGISRKKSQHFYYKVWAAGFQPVFLFPLFYYPRSAGKKGNWNNETISCGHYRMHRHGGPAVRHHFGEPPLVPRYGGGRQRQKRRQDLRGGRSRPLGHEDPSPRRHGEAPCAGRGKRYG